MHLLALPAGARHEVEMSYPQPGLIRGVSLQDRLIAGGVSLHVADLLVKVMGRAMVVKPRNSFREPGALRDEVIYVRAGLLSKYKIDDAGGRQTVALRFPGDGILPSEGAADYGIEAVTLSEVLVGRAEDFFAIADSSPEVQRLLRKSSDRHVSISYEWLLNSGRRDSISRVAHLLCETAERSGTDLNQSCLMNPFTQQQVAQITGQTPVNVNRVFADLDRLGLIRRKGRRIEVDDWQELRRVARFNWTYLQ